MRRPAIITRREADLRRAIGGEVERLRLDGGLTRADLARACGLDPGYLLRVERGDHGPSLDTLLRISDALGTDLVIRQYPNTGPRIHDRHQAPITEALLSILHPRWRPTGEVGVTKPVRGWVDVALHDPRDAILVATEVESLIRRIEQLLRWHEAKASAIPSSRLWPFVAAEEPPVISRLLVIRSTRTNREIARDHGLLLRSAYPGRTAEARAALTGTSRWPGASILWADTRPEGVRIMDGPPRGVAVGR